MTVALLFPGQGTQHETMLPWLEAEPAARPVLAWMAERLGDDWRARVADAAWSQSNAIAQPLVTGASLAASGMLAADDALALSQRRAAAMDACAGDGQSGLLGLSNVDPEDVAAACARWGLEVAIRTGARRCIVGGDRAALDAAAAHLAALGAKTTPLGVRVASHTRAMRAAVPALAQALAGARWQPPRVAWVAGITGAAERDPAAVQRLLAEQVATTVRWDACMDAVAERRPDAVLEVGPGTTLARLWRERFPAIPARACDEFASRREIVEWIADATRP